MPVDFIFCIGCDSTNENKFAYLSKLKRNQHNLKLKQREVKEMSEGKQSNGVVSPSVNMYTCTIGMKETQAMYYLNDCQSAVEVFENLSNPERIKEALKLT